VNSLARLCLVYSCFAVATLPPMERFEGRLVDDVFGDLTHRPHPAFSLGPDWHQRPELHA